MVKSKLVLGVALLLFGSSATAGLIAQAEALYVRPTVKPVVSNPVLQVVETSVDSATETDIAAIIGPVEPVSIGPATFDLIADAGNPLTAGTHVEALISLPPEIAQPVPAPPVLWLFVAGLVGLIGCGRQRKAA